MCPIMTSGAPGATGATSDSTSYDFEWLNMFVQDILVKGLLLFFGRAGEIYLDNPPQIMYSRQ